MKKLKPFAVPGFMFTVLNSLFRTSAAVLLLFVLAGAESLYADTWEYITYGGYNAAVEAWKRVALIFSAADYKSLLFLAAVFSALVFFYAVIISAITGGKPGSIFAGWMAPFVLGLVLTAAFVLPKDKVIVYDEVLQRGPYEVNGVPKILAATAGMLNRVERAIIKIIDDSVVDDEAKYSVNAGGISYEVLKNLFSWSVNEAVLANAKYLLDSLRNYINDCVVFEIQRSGGTTINEQKIATGQITLQRLIKEAENPAVYTTVYSSDGSTNEGVSCYGAGEYILGELGNVFDYNNPDSPAYGILRAVCASSGFDSDVGGISRCVSLAQKEIENISNNLGLQSYSLAAAQYAYLMGLITLDAAISSDPNKALYILASQNAMSNLWAMGEKANLWFPVIIETLSSFAIAVMPLLLVFMVTPVAGRAFKIVMGLFIWLLCVRIADAAIFTYGKQLALMYAPALGQGASYNWGTAIAMAMPGYTTKIVAMLGAMRWASFAFASFVSMIILSWGGYLLAAVAGELTGGLGLAGGMENRLMSSPAETVFGGVMPKYTLGGAAAMVGDMGRLAHGIAEMEIGSTVGRFRAGMKLGRELIAEGTGGNILGSMGSGVATSLFVDAYGFSQLVEGSVVQLLRTNIGGPHSFFDISHPVLSRFKGKPLSESDIAKLEVAGYQVKELEGKKGLFEISLPGSSAKVYYDKSTGEWYVLGLGEGAIGASIAKSISRREAIDALLRTGVKEDDIINLGKRAFYGVKGQGSVTNRIEYGNTFSHEFNKGLKLSGLFKSLADTVKKVTNQDVIGFYVGTGGNIMAIGKGGIPLPVNISIGENFQNITVTETSTNRSFTFQLDADQSHRLREVYTNAHMTAIADTLSTESGREYLKNVSKGMGGNIETAIDTAYQRVSTLQTRITTNIEDAIINLYMRNKYGDLLKESPEQAIVATLADLRQMRLQMNYDELFNYVNDDMIKEVISISPESVDDAIDFVAEITSNRYSPIKNEVEKNTSIVPDGDPKKAFKGVSPAPRKSKKELEKKYEENVVKSVTTAEELSKEQEKSWKYYREREEWKKRKERHPNLFGRNPEGVDVRIPEPPKQPLPPAPPHSPVWITATQIDTKNVQHIPRRKKTK